MSTTLSIKMGNSEEKKKPKKKSTEIMQFILELKQIHNVHVSNSVFYIDILFNRLHLFLLDEKIFRYIPKHLVLVYK